MLSTMPLPLTQLLPNSSSLPHQSLGVLAMQALCTLLLLSVPLPFPLKAEGTRGILELNQTPYIKQEENIQSYFNLLKGKEPWFKSAMSSSISLFLERSLIRRGVQSQGVALMILDESSCGYCHKPAGCTKTGHFTLHSLCSCLISQFLEAEMASRCINKNCYAKPAE